MFKVILFAVLAMILMWGVGKLKYVRYRNVPYQQLSDEFFKGTATVVTTIYVFVCIKSNLADVEAFIRRLVKNGELATIAFILLVTFILIGFWRFILWLSEKSGEKLKKRIERSAVKATR